MNIVFVLCGFLCVSAQRSQLKAALKDQYWKSWEHKTRQGELEWLAAAESKFGQEPARPGGWSGSTSVYVDGRNGADSNDGSFGHPLKTLTAARDMVRKWPSLPTGGIEIVLRCGEYTFQDSPFTLDGPQDSGTAASPITYTAYESENVVLSAGQSLPGNLYKSVLKKKVIQQLYLFFFFFFFFFFFHISFQVSPIQRGSPPKILETTLGKST